MSTLDEWIKPKPSSKPKEETKPVKNEPIKTTLNKTEKILQAEVDVDSSNQFLIKTSFSEFDGLSAVELKGKLSILHKLAKIRKAALKINWKNNSFQIWSKEIIYEYAKNLLQDKPMPESELITQIYQTTLSAYVSEEKISLILKELIDEGKLFKDDKDVISLKTVAENSPYTLPVGSVSVYYREGEGFKYHYDANTYKKEHEDPDKALLANLGILATIWNKLIDLEYSPRYLSKAYDDDIYAIVLTNTVPTGKESDEYMEVDRLRIHISKHPLDAKILDLSQWTPVIPDEIEKEMFDRNIDFKNPMLKYQELKSKTQEKKSEKPTEQEPTKEECKKYTVEYIRQLLENDPYIYDPRFQKIWYTDEITYAFQHNNWHTNSGHFNYVMKGFTECWKKNGGDMWDFNEKLLPIIHQYKNKHLRELLKYWQDDLERNLKIMRDYAKEQDVEETETWRKHSLQTWRDLNLIREKLELTLLPIPEILNYSTREIINRVLSEGNKENELDKYTKPTKNSNQSEEGFICEICGKRTDKLHQLRTGQYAEFLPDKKVCMDCYVREYKKFYEKYGRCPECGAKIHLREWPDFECENGHSINVNFIEVDNKKLFDDIYGKVSPEEYKKLYDKYFTIKSMIEEKYNKLVCTCSLAIVDKSVTGVEYDPICYYTQKDLKNKIRKIEDAQEGMIAGIIVFFKDYSEIWMNEDLVEIEKPEPVKNVEKYLKKTVQEYKSNNSEEDSSTTTHTPLTEWTG